MSTDALVVSAEFSGSVVAENLATAGLRAWVIDKRLHIGVNAYDTFDARGVPIYRYRPHIFHTNGEIITNYLSQFTAWRPYEHRVLAEVDGQLPIPINIDAVNLYGLNLTETIDSFYDVVREHRENIRASEHAGINAVGRDLYEKFFRGASARRSRRRNTHSKRWVLACSPRLKAGPRLCDGRATVFTRHGT